MLWLVIPGRACGYLVRMWKQGQLRLRTPVTQKIFVYVLTSNLVDKNFLVTFKNLHKVPVYQTKKFFIRRISFSAHESPFDVRPS